MASSGGSANPMYLSQGAAPIPNLPIAGQGTPAPQNAGTFQNFLPDIPAAGQGPAPSARGLTSEMFQYKSPQGVAAPSGGGGGGGSGSDLSAAEAYAQAHLARYGYRPDSSNPVYASMLGQGGSGAGGADSQRQQLAALQFGAARSGPAYDYNFNPVTTANTGGGG